ncbi:MAG: sulfite exporter TauE/SafE family protein [Thermaerobacter sp.]|nr:sulfite exporter TauE/SafE family protein [Thermaerobacter sp.]
MAVFLAIGVVSGLFNGMSSVGGSLFASFSLIAVPPLAFGETLSMLVVGTYSAAVSLVSAATGFLGYWRKRGVKWDLILTVGMSAMVGSVAGTRVAFVLGNRILMLVLTGVLVVSWWIFLHPVESNRNRTKLAVPAALGIGLGVGILGGMLGVGAGFLLLPLSVGILGLPIRDAIVNSLAGGFLISIATLFTRVPALAIDWTDMAGLLVGAMIGARIGVRLNQLSSERLLSRVSAVLLLLITVDTGFKTALLWVR